MINVQKFNKIYLYYENERFTYDVKPLGTLKIMLNRRNNEMTNVKIRKKKYRVEIKIDYYTSANKLSSTLELFLHLFQITLQETKSIFVSIKIQINL